MTKLLFGCIEYPIQCWGHVYCFCFWKLLFCCPMSQVALISLGQALSSQGQHQQFMSAKALLQKTWSQHQHFKCGPSRHVRQRQKSVFKFHYICASCVFSYAICPQEMSISRRHPSQRFRVWAPRKIQVLARVHGLEVLFLVQKGWWNKIEKVLHLFSKKGLVRNTYQQMQVIADCKRDVMLRLHLVVSNSLQASDVVASV